MERLRPYLRWRTINLVLFALILVALGVVLGPIALNAPAVLRVTPADGVANANPAAGIQLVFSQWVRPDSVQSAVAFDPPVAFAVIGAGFPQLGPAIVTIQPTGGLRYAAKYRLTLGAGVRNMLGRASEQPLSIAFATAPYVTVAQFGPGQDAKDIALNAPITVEFGAPVVPAAQIAAAAEDPRLADALPQPLTLAPAAEGVGRWLSPTLFGFYPAAELHAATKYTASLRPDVTPDGSARLEQPVSWSFQTAAPLLAGTRPYDGAIDTPASGEIEVRLARDVDVASAGKAFVLRALDTGVPVQGSIQPVDGGFLFKPAAALERGARYEASLGAGVVSSIGAHLNDQPLTWNFSVIGDLEVAQVEPLADTAEVLTDTHRISVRFNHPVVALTTLDAQAALSQPLAITPALVGEGRWLDTSTYVFTPKDGLAPSTSYSVRVAAGLQDQTGGALRQEYTWHFSTITPNVIASLPSDGARYAGPSGPIQLVFNQPMDLTSLRSAVSLRRDGANVPGTLTRAVSSTLAPDQALVAAGTWTAGVPVSGFVVTFTPDAPLERGADYTLVVGQGARAASVSSTLAAGYSTSFRVAPLPSLADSEPANGATAAEADGSLRLVFSAPMDWDSVERSLLIEPKPTEIFTGTGQAEFYVYFQFKPDTDYRVTIGAAARDLFGVSLGQDAQISFHTASLPPALALVGAYRLGSYNAYVPARVPVQHVGTPTVSYKLYRLDPADVMSLANDYDRWNEFSPAASTLVKQNDVSLSGDRNQQRIDVLDLGRLDAGAYYLEVSGPNNAFDRQIMVVSPYALTIKRSPEKLFVWAIDLATGKPVADIPLTAAAYSYDNSLKAEPAALGRTDAEGILQATFAPPDSSSPLFLWSPAGARFAFGTTNWGEGIGPWDFGLPADYAHSPLIGNIYTDRPIYRPDQNVYIRGALRMAQDERYTLPGQGQQAFLTISDPEGNAVYSATLALSEFGTFNTSFPLERGAMLGNYTIGVGSWEPGVGGGSINPQLSTSNPQVTGSFSVAEYRKPAFEVTATPAKPDLIQGDTLEVSVAAHYFSGGAMVNAPVHWRLLANPLYFAPESAANFSFEDLDDAYAWYRWDDNQPTAGGEQVADGQAQTDAQGNFSVKLPATLGKDNHSRTLTLDIEVTDVDGQVIAAQGTANVHAGAFYIGLRPDGYVVQAGQTQNVAIVTLDPQGQPVANRALKVSLYKRIWNSVRQQGADGQLYWTSSFSDTLVETKDATTDAQGGTSTSFTPKDGGEYRIGAEGRDDAGHSIKSSAYSWVYGGDVFWGVNDTNRVDLIADKSSYTPGDTAGILVTAPYAGMSALMTIERGEVIEHKLFTLKGTTELLQVPISAGYAPNVYVSVVLVKPAGGDLPVPDLRVGIVNLPVSTEQQELTIAVATDKPEAGPRDEVTYTIKATDHSGKGVRAEIGLALVDKAVLSLADDPNPTFKQAFYTKRPLGVFTSQSLTALVDRVTLK
ncbi:MAG: Ig-like domain-containing protein, partial [Roseiflexaceae bacterium]